MDAKVKAWLDPSPPAQKAQLETLRGIILASANGIAESFKWGQPCYALNSLFCYLQRSKTHVTLGFQKGAQMAGRVDGLQGDGTQMRHIKFAPGEAIDEPKCRKLVALAIALDDS